MIREFEQYHGVVLRHVIVCAPGPVTLAARDEAGRVNSFTLNGSVGLHLKHSSKRLAPWGFTFTADNDAEIEWLAGQTDALWVALVCGRDGVVALSYDEYQAVTDCDPGATKFIRLDRDRRTQYRVFGNAGRLIGAKRRGIAPIIAQAFGSSEDAVA